MKKLLLSVILLPLLGGCLGVEAVKVLAYAPGYIDATVTIAGRLYQVARPISDQEEYYIGRAVAGRLLATYKLSENRKLTDYLNLVGSSIVLHSDRVDTFGGYHFALIESEEPNAFACPGGTIFVTTGMVKFASNEDQLAAVLAHEIAHINNFDGIAEIKKSRWTGLFSAIGTSAAKQYGPDEIAQVAGMLDEAVDDVFQALVVSGYSRDNEYRADETALTYVTKAGYDPASYREFLNSLIRSGRATEGGIIKTHPSTAERIDRTREKTWAKADPALMQSRTDRFFTAVK